MCARVVRVHGLQSVVEAADGRLYRCAVRRLLRSHSTDERNIITTGDRVWIRPALNDEGFIERVEPRHGVLTRASRRHQHVIVANVDQVVFVTASDRQSQVEEVRRRLDRRVRVLSPG